MATAPIPAPVDFLGSPLHPVTTHQFIDIVTGAALSRRKLRVTYLNAHCANLAARDPDYRAALTRCDIVYADGQGVVWASRRLGTPVPERVNAGDFIIDFCRECAAKNLRVYLLGCADGLAQRTAGHWKSRVPSLQIVGTHHGFFSRDDEDTVAARITAARPDILIVGMSAPRQEIWMNRWAPRLDAPVVWCVGALFEYYSATRARAPLWVRRFGLEWLFRLVLEPRRLWRRYLIGNIEFAWRVLEASRKGR